MNETETERVSESTCLCVIINEDLKLGKHVNYITEKASKRLFYLRQLKYAGLSKSDLIKVYKSRTRTHAQCGQHVLRSPNQTKLNPSKRGLQKLYDQVTPIKKQWKIPVLKLLPPEDKTDA
jgi:hypothetical protein